MTVALITSIERFVGLSTDTKPTGPRAGSLFYETDTGAQYLYDGAAWQLYLVGGPFRASKTIAFTGAANLGAIGNVPLFTVTGEGPLEKNRALSPPGPAPRGGGPPPARAGS